MARWPQTHRAAANSLDRVFYSAVSAYYAAKTALAAFIQIPKPPKKNATYDEKWKSCFERIHHAFQSRAAYNCVKARFLQECRRFLAYCGNEWPYIVIGDGGAGITMANLLVRAGKFVIVLESRPQHQTREQQLYFSLVTPETAETFKQKGLLDVSFSCKHRASLHTKNLTMRQLLSEQFPAYGPPIAEYQRVMQRDAENYVRDHAQKGSAMGIVVAKILAIDVSRDVLDHFDGVAAVINATGQSSHLRYDLFGPVTTKAKPRDAAKSRVIIRKSYSPASEIDPPTAEALLQIFRKSGGQPIWIYMQRLPNKAFQIQYAANVLDGEEPTVKVRAVEGAAQAHDEMCLDEHATEPTVVVRYSLLPGEITHSACIGLRSSKGLAIPVYAIGLCAYTKAHFQFTLQMTCAVFQELCPRSLRSQIFPLYSTYRYDQLFFWLVDEWPEHRRRKLAATKAELQKSIGVFSRQAHSEARDRRAIENATQTAGRCIAYLNWCENE